MRPAFSHTALVCRVVLVAIVAALWGANPAEAASGRAGCCRMARKAEASCCCRSTSARFASADATRADTLQQPSCRCQPDDPIPADRSGPVVTPDPPSNRAHELEAALLNPAGSSGPHRRLAHHVATSLRTPLYLRLSRLLT